MRVVEDLHVCEMAPLIAPRELKRQFALNDTVINTVYEGRETIKRILHRQDPRLLLVVGPCSIHDPEAALIYAKRLYEAHLYFRDRLFIIMRVYLEKPRTTVGWRGIINDPDINGSFDMINGLKKARGLLLHINQLGLPAATEMLDPISPQYISDLISLATIGARTTEAQTHRALASGLSMPVGFKNSTDGNIQVAVNSFLSATQPHSFLGINQDGMSAVVKTKGNPDGLIILRGSRTRTNYDIDSIKEAKELLNAVGLSPAVMIDCSHANSQYDHTQQAVVWNTVLQQRQNQLDSVIGMMIESNLYEGKQSIPTDFSQLHFGVSITDACVGWDTTERMLHQAYAAMRAHL